MGTRPDALYSAVLKDLSAYMPLGPVAPSMLPPDVSYKQFVSTSLAYDLVRKWTPSDAREADANAKEKFLASNKKCRDWRLTFEDEADRLLYGEFKRHIDDFLHPLGEPLFSSYADLHQFGKVGPGTSLAARGQSLYAKLFSSKLSASSYGLYKVYRDNVQASHSSWFQAECLRSDQYGEVDIVRSSRCSFVPKTRDTSRMICVEPSVNMFYQLGLGTILEDRLSRLYNIDLSTQPEKNRLLAQRGSLDGSFSTIDLSSASDSLSLKMCEDVFPTWFFQTLLELRSHTVSLDGSPVPLNMISTMGNGFTFPLQTVMFSCLIRAAYSVEDIPLQNGWSPRGTKYYANGEPVSKHTSTFNWCCFGDDLIVDKRAYRNVRRLLRIIGCEVNNSKTFFEGPFRESCGADWFYGQPARSVFVKRLRSPQDIFVAINLLNGWSAYTGIPLISTVQCLTGWLRSPAKDFAVPFDENIEAGIRVPAAYLSNLPRRCINTGSILYRTFVASPKKIRFVADTIHYPRGVKRLIYNPNGLLISFLYGELESGGISIRLDRSLYRRKLRSTPYWDYQPRDSLTNGYRLSWQQWETAVLINLSNP